MDNPLYLEGTLGKIASYNNLRETPKLVFMYHILQKSGIIEVTKPLEFLFNKKEDHSLLHYLYSNNFISKHELYLEGYLKNEELISIHFSLTEDGLANVDKIIEAYFAAINSIKKDENLQKALDNLETIDQSLFINKEDKISQFPDDVNDILRLNYMFGPENMLGNPINLTYEENRVKEILEELSPSNSFIFIDSKEEVTSKYLEGAQNYITKNYKLPYKMNNISNELLNELKTKITVDDYTFNLRSDNNDYTKLTQLTQEACYKNKTIKCENNEYDPENDENFLPYSVKNDENIVSLMKIDRSFGVPFVKGYIEIELDDKKYKDFLNNTDNEMFYYLFLYSFNYKFYFSSLFEAGTVIEFSESILPKISITFSTYNDLLDKVIEYIIDFFSQPIKEDVFTSLKEEYYLSKAKNPQPLDIYYDAFDIFEQFISANVKDTSPINKENIINVSYNNFENFFYNITDIKYKLTYLTYGDISLDKSKSTTDKLSSLIPTPEINLFLSEQKKVVLKNKTSILYTTKAENQYQRQGSILVMYEYDDSLDEDMEYYALCVDSFFFDYLRTKRATGYGVFVFTNRVKGKNYLEIFAFGKNHSPERMDRFINEAIKESFDLKICRVNDIKKHSQNVVDSYFNYAEIRMMILQESLKNQQSVKLNKNLENKNEDEYKKIVKNVKKIFTDNFKRIAILYHRGDITEGELEEQKKQLDENYFFDSTIKNEVTDKIDYLKDYLK